MDSSEILLDIPDTPKKSEYFSQKVDGEIRTPHSVFEERRNPKNNPVSMSRAGWWAWDFYKLRNRIVHGDRMDIESLRYREGSWITHNIVADLVFMLLMKLELLRHGCYSDEVQKVEKRLDEISKLTGLPRETRDNGIIFPFGWKSDFEEIQETLGWISKSKEGVGDGQVP